MHSAFLGLVVFFSMAALVVIVDAGSLIPLVNLKAQLSAVLILTLCV